MFKQKEYQKLVFLFCWNRIHQYYCKVNVTLLLEILLEKCLEALNNVNLQGAKIGHDLDIRYNIKTIILFKFLTQNPGNPLC